MKKLALLAFTLFSAWNMDAKTITGPVDYVSPLVGSVVSDSLRPRGVQHARLPCPSPSPGICSNSCPLSQ